MIIDKYLMYKNYMLQYHESINSIYLNIVFYKAIDSTKRYKVVHPAKENEEHLIYCSVFFALRYVAVTDIGLHQISR